MKLTAFGAGVVTLLAMGGGPASVLAESCDGAQAEVTGTPRILESCGAVAADAGVRRAGELAVVEVAPQLGVEANELEVIDVSRSVGGDYVRFQQEIDGVPVFNGQVVVSLGANNQVRGVASNAIANGPADDSASLSSADAVKLATAAVAPGATQRSLPSAELVAYPAGEGSTLAWHVVIPTASPAADWNVVLDASSGRVLARWDGIFEVDGSGLVFSPNPVQDTGNTALVDGADAATPALDAARSNVTLTNLGAVNNKLVGDFADLAGTGINQGPTLPYVPGTADEVTRVYNYDRSNDRFEEATVYHAITEAQKLIQSLGFTDVNDRSIPIDVHYNSQDNSFFSTGDGGLHFGDGGVDDAEDADIVIHEYGHSIHQDQVPGWGGGEQGAMGEGFGDLLAVMSVLRNGRPRVRGDGSQVLRGRVGCGVLQPGHGQSGQRLPALGERPQREHRGRHRHLFRRPHPGARRRSLLVGGDDLRVRRPRRRHRGPQLAPRAVIESHESQVPDASDAAFENQIGAMLVADQTLNAGANITLIQTCALARGLVVAPAAPVITGTNPASGANDNAPKVLGTQAATGTPTQVKIYKNATCTGAPDTTGSVAAFTGAGITINVADDSLTALSARASGVGGDSPCSNTINYQEVTPVTPDAPVITAATPASGANDNAPEVRGTQSNVGPPTTIAIFKNATCTGTADATGTVAEFTGAGITVNVPDNSTTALSAKATGVVGDSGCSNSISYQEVTPAGGGGGGGGGGDTAAPETKIDSGPKPKSKKRKATFAFSSSEAGSKFACSLNGAAFAPCSSPSTLTAKKGKNTFAVTAIDAAGNIDATPASYSWKVKKKRKR